MDNLPRRLAAVSSLIPPGKVVADIGTDHGFLAVYLIKSGLAKKVIASDIHQGPFERARKYIHYEGLEDHIDVRLGGGLDVLSPGEVDVIVIAGLGGNTIVEILGKGLDLLADVETLVLNPATHESEVRQWLSKNGRRLMEEDLVEDQGKLYQVISASHGEQPEAEEWTWLDYEVGPLILRKRHPLLKEYLKRKLKKYEGAVNNLRQSNSRDKERLCLLLSHIEEIKAFYEEL